MTALRSIAVVGGSLAAVSSVRALRAQGFDGTVTVVSAEGRLPYDRPPLSKAFLAGTTDVTDLALLADGEESTAQWRLGVPAVGLGSDGVELADGSVVHADGVVLATGARPRVPWDLPPGVHVLRTLDDAVALRADLVPGARLVVIGAGFIGAEVASTARGLGVEVTVVDASPVPLVEILGHGLAPALTSRHERNGVRLVTGVGVQGFPVSAARDRVVGVGLADGRILAADAVVVGVGAVPNVEWLAGSGLSVGNGVLCDSVGATDRPGVVAVGDCAAWWDDHALAHRRVEHWTSARERAAIAVSTLLHGSRPGLMTERPPYFWSDQYGLRLQMTGHIRPDDGVSIEEGGLDAPEFLAVYRRQGEPVAVAALGCTRSFMRWRKQLASARQASARPAPLAEAV